MNARSRTSAQMTLPGFDRSTCSPGSGDGASRSASPACPTTPPSGPGPVPASPSPSPAEVEASTTSATSGPSCASSSASARLQSSLESRLRARLAEGGSPLYALTWRTWAMPSGPPICALRASARRTSDSGCTGERSGWPTPVTADCDRGPSPGRSRLGGPNLTDVAGWATPMASDATGSTHCYGPRRIDGTRERYLKLPGQAAGWPTPTARDSKDGIPQAAVEVSALLGRQVWTPGATTDGSSAPTDDRGRLHPSHAGWMMGYPREWDSCGAAATRSCRSSRRRS